MNKPCFAAKTILSLVALGITTLTVPSTRAADGPLPKGWGGTHPGEYRLGTDPDMQRDGRPSAFIMAMKSNPAGFGTMTQFFSAAEYLGKRVRFKGFLKTRDVTGEGTGLWLRIDDANRRALQFDNMASRYLKGTTDWTEVSVVLDVPETADSFAMGVLLVGPGRVWVNSLTLDVVDSTVPVTFVKPVMRKRPANLGFTE